MRTITVEVERTYYKSVEVEIQVPKNVSDDDLKDYLIESEELDDLVSDALGDASLNGGETEYQFSNELGDFGGTF